MGTSVFPLMENVRADGPGYEIAVGYLHKYGSYDFSARQIARATNGDLYVVYFRNDGGFNQIFMKKSADNGENWVNEEKVQSESLDQENPVILIDSMDRIVVIWRYSYDTSLYCRIKSGGSWGDKEMIASSVSDGLYTQILDADDNIHVLYTVGYEGSCCYRKRTSAGWQPEELVAGGYWQRAESITVESNGIVHVFFNDASGATYYNLMHCKRVNGVWSTPVMIDQPNNELGSCSCAITTDDGNIHVIWVYKTGSTRKILYRKYVNNVWLPDIETIASDSIYYLAHSSLSVDANNYLYVVWHGQYSGSPTISQLRWRKYTGSWGAIENLTSASVDQKLPILIWGLYPEIGGDKINRPITGFAFIWNDGSMIKFYKSPDLAWDGGGNQNKGKILVYSTTSAGVLYDKTYFDTSLLNLLENYGYDTVVTDRKLTPQLANTLLENYDELWILSTFPPSVNQFSQSEIDAILNFRNQGHGLLIMADHTDSSNIFSDDANQISVPLGVTFYGSVNQGENGGSIYPNFVQHPLFTAVSSIACHESEAQMVVNNPAQVVATHANNNLIAVLDDGDGRVVFDTSFTRLFDAGFAGFNWILIGDTLQYVRNIADWLTGDGNQPPTTGLVGYWSFDEGSGTIAHDSSGIGNDGTLLGGVTWTTETKSGTGYALNFDGINDYVDVGNDASLNPLDKISLAAWVKLDEFGDEQGSHIISRGGDRITGYYSLHVMTNHPLIYPERRQKFFFGFLEPGGPVTPYGWYATMSNTIIALNEWYYVVGVYDGATCKFYVNGNLDSVVDGPTTRTNIDYPVFIGHHNMVGFEYFFDGIIDEARIYNKALSQTEIQNLYNQGGGNQPPEKPNLLSPGTLTDTGFIVNTKTPTFEWNSVPNADHYALYISHEPYGEANLVYDSEDDYAGGKIYGTSFNELPNNILQNGVKYRWDMRAFNDYGSSYFSDELYFKVQTSSSTDISIVPNSLRFYNDEPPFLPNVLKINVTVTNSGSEIAQAVLVIFSLNGNELGTTDLGEVPPNQKINATVKWTADSNIENSEIEVEVTSSNDIDPSNNIKTQPLSFYWVNFQHNVDAFSFPNWRSSTKDRMELLIHYLLDFGFPLVWAAKMATVLFESVLMDWSPHCYGMAVTSFIYKMRPDRKPMNINTFAISRDDAYPDIIKNHFTQIFLFGKLNTKVFDASTEYNLLLQNIKQGDPGVIVMPIPLHGHGAVVYKILDFGNRTEMFIYENNRPYDDPNDGYPLDPAKKKTRDINITMNLSGNYISYDLVGSDNNHYHYSQFYYVNPLDYDVRELLTKMIGLCKDYMGNIWNELKNVLFIHCPVSVDIIDEYGRTIQIINGTVFNENPDATVVKDNDSFLIYLPMNLRYNVTLTGTSNGVFNVDFISANSSNLSRIISFENISIMNNISAFFTIQQNNSIFNVTRGNEIFLPNSSLFNVSNFPPFANIKLPELCYVNTNISFNGNSSYDYEGNLTEYRWDFGDGSTGTGKTITHVYSTPGNYTVTLTVFDAGNLSNSSMKTICVISPLNITNEYPLNTSVSVPRPPAHLQVTVNDIDAEPMNILIRWKNHQGIWETLTSFSNVENGTYNFIPSGNNWVWGNTTYIWSVNVTDGTSWTNKTYQYTTKGSRYDVNNNNMVNFQDAGLVWTHRTSLVSYDGLYDVNQNGNVNFQDAGLTWIHRD